MEFLPQTDFLKGTKVLIIAHYLPGGVAAMLLNKMGAVILKVEPPGGEMSRKLPPFVEVDGKMTSTYFHSFNAGIECLELDFKTEAGSMRLAELIKSHDILVDGNRTGFLETCLKRKVHELNPDLLYIPITAFGISGAQKFKAGHDGNAMAESGALSYGRTDADGLPALPGFHASDVISGMFAVIMALGKAAGQYNIQSKQQVKTFDSSMLKGASFLNHMYQVEQDLAGSSPKMNEGMLNGSLANYKIYKCADGKWIFLGALEEKLFSNFCDHIGQEDWKSMAFVKNEALKSKLEALFLQKTRDEWVEAFQGVDCCLSPVLELSETGK